MHVLKLCILAHTFEKLRDHRYLRYAIWNLKTPSGFGDLRHSRTRSAILILEYLDPESVTRTIGAAGCGTIFW